MRILMGCMLPASVFGMFCHILPRLILGGHVLSSVGSSLSLFMPSQLVSKVWYVAIKPHIGLSVLSIKRQNSAVGTMAQRSSWQLCTFWQAVATAMTIS